MPPFLAWMQAIVAFIARFGTCCIAGMLVGIVAGAFLELVALVDGPPVLTTAQTLAVGLLVAVPGALFTAWIMVALLRLPAAVVLPALMLNAALVGMVTAVVVAATGAWFAATWIGLVAGAVIGRLLCLLRACPGAKDGL